MTAAQSPAQSNQGGLVHTHTRTNTHIYIHKYIREIFSTMTVAQAPAKSNQGGLVHTQTSSLQMYAHACAVESCLKIKAQFPSEV
jgi:hypothetical protein